MYQLFEEVDGNLEVFLRVSHGHQHGIVGRFPGKDRSGGFQPVVQLLPFFFASQIWTIGDIVGMAHERINSTECVSLIGWEDDKAVVKVLGGAPCDSPADGIGMRELLVHSSLPAAARATSQSLRALEITGLRSSTSKCWRSMAFSISCPPRLKSSRSTASSRLTILTSGAPRSNHSRARWTSNFISSRNCGVARRCAMSSSVTPKRCKSSSGR